MIAAPPNLPTIARYPPTTVTFIRSLSSQMAFYDPSHAGANPQPSFLDLDPASRELLRTAVGMRLAEDEDAPPTDFAIGELIRLVPYSMRQLGKKWNEPHIETDGYGGIRLSWRKAENEVRAVIRGDLQTQRYLYWERDNQYGSVPDFTATTLYAYLDHL